MTVHSFYLFDRAGTCLCYREWGRPAGAGDAGDDRKNMFGMLFALRQFCGQLAPAGAAPGAGALRHFVAGAYALHYLETPTGLRFVLTTSRDFGPADLVPHLREIYADIYVEYVVKNPLYVRGQVITSERFFRRLDAYVRDLPCF